MTPPSAESGTGPDRRRARFAWALGGFAVAAGLASIPLLGLMGDQTFHPFNVASITGGISMGLVGGVLASRQPRNLVGWLFLVIALSQSGVSLAGGYVETADIGRLSLPGVEFAAWAATWIWAPGLVSMLTFAVLLFPDGRLPSPRWRPIGWLAGAALGLLVLPPALVALEDPLTYAMQRFEATTHPVLSTLEALGTATVGLAALGSLAALVARYRDADLTTRLQLKWFVSAAVTEVGLIAVLVVAVESGWSAGPLPSLAAMTASILVPAAVGVAVLRYRLYEIDRIISRTVSYAALTIILGGAYVASVVGLGGVVRSIAGDGGGDLVVAASTLMVAALFRPLRRRIQDTVDHRFNRSAYDARRTIDSFGRRLRHNADLSVLSRELREVTARTVQPMHVSLWLRPPDATREPPGPPGAG